MLTLYTVCAVAAGAVLVLQFVLALIGLDHDGDLSGAGHGDLGDAGYGGDISDGHGVDTATDGGGAHHHAIDAHDSSWFFRLVSLRSLVAALAFFGLGGGLSTSAGFSQPMAFSVAVGVGVAAMALVAWIMQLLMNLREEGTAYIQNAIGQPASVYLKIPARRTGTGKITVAVQNRSVEYEAVTDGEELPMGSQVIVADVINENTVRVERNAE